mgnify:CR=1 FL=1
MMIVPIPIGRVYMNFDITCPDGVVNFDFRIKEVWTGILVVLAIVQYLYALSVGSCDVVPVKIIVLPHIVEKGFWDLFHEILF